MGRIEGTAPKPRTLRSRIRLPRINFEPVVLVVIFAPVVLLAPDDFLRSVAFGVVIGVAWLIGRSTGRSDLARELLDDEVRRVRRDVPAA